MKHIATLILVFLLGYQIDCKADESGTAPKAPELERAFYPNGIAVVKPYVTGPSPNLVLGYPAEHSQGTSARPFNIWMALKVLTLVLCLVRLAMLSNSWPEKPPANKD
jgi:hypothetical protein